jgi:hypothetical protein
MRPYLQFLTEDSTVLGLTFQNWIPLVTMLFVAWVAAVTPKL